MPLHAALLAAHPLHRIGGLVRFDYCEYLTMVLRTALLNATRRVALSATAQVRENGKAGEGREEEKERLFWE